MPTLNLLRTIRKAQRVRHVTDWTRPRLREFDVPPPLPPFRNLSRRKTEPLSSWRCLRCWRWREGRRTRICTRTPPLAACCLAR
eukprot:756313-Prorocentrum_minimum.AAC.1